LKPTAAAFLVGLGSGAFGGWFGAVAGAKIWGSPAPARGSPTQRSSSTLPARPPPAPGGTAGAHGGAILVGSAGSRPEGRARPVEATPTARGLVGLATYHAVSGMRAEFLEAAEGALRGGAAFEDLLAALYEVPQPARAELVAALLDRVPDAPYEPTDVVRILAEGGQNDRALSVVREALPRAPGLDPELARWLVRLDPQGAVASLQQVAERGGWDPGDLGVVRALLAEAGAEDRLVPFLERGLDKRPGDHDLLRWLRKADSAAAGARVAALLRESPGDPWLWNLLGEIRRDAGSTAEAYEAFRQAAERDPSRDAFRDLVKTDPAKGLAVVAAWAKDSQDDERIGTLAEMYALAGRPQDAVREYLRAHERDPADSTWLDRVADLDPTAAIEAMERRMAAAPGDPTDDELGRYGRALEKAGRGEQAFEQYLAAHRKRPGEERWTEALARSDPKRAVPLLEAHVRERPGDAAARGALGLGLVSLRRGAEAVPHLEHALARGDVDRWFPVFRQVDARHAVDVLWHRAVSEPTNADLWGMLGRELRGTDRAEEARAAFEHAAALDPARREWAAALRDLR
jgi:predicted Zn-dependent protease